VADCDCAPGHYCAEAIRLAARAHELREAWEANRTEENWEKHLEAKRKLDAHRDKKGLT
jgi:hypothetical protein